jgi:anoctamin-8
LRSLLQFQFVNSFLSLFYIAFYLQDQEKLKEVRDSHSYFVEVKLKNTYFLQQLAALLIARQVIGNIKESALPYFLEQLRLAKLSFDMFGALSPSDEAKKDLGEAESGDSKTEEEDSPKEDAAKDVGELEASVQPDKEVDKKSRNLSQAELEGALFKVSFFL